jgi:hypothetical protein
MKKINMLVLLCLVLLAACSAPPVQTKEDLVVYKSVTCGCCGVWSKHMSQEGYGVKEIDTQYLAAKKSEFNIPSELQSCHTGFVDGYVVEGHIPSYVVDKMLEEQPDIAGIALPGMPIGTPGMPGPKQEDWTIYALHHNGSYEEYVVI